MLNTVIIQPPLVQLNTPYPSGAYLLDFFNRLYAEKNISGKVEWFDLSNSFFHKIFCKEGLSKIFSKTFSKALSLADKYEAQGDDNTPFQLRRFVSQAEAWQNWIDEIIAIVCSGGSKGKISGREFAHEFIRSAHVPRGNRIEQFLSSLTRDVSTDDAQILSSLALADLADYITLVYDNNFALIRYAEHLATSTSSFSDAENGLSSASLVDFYEPLLMEKLQQYKGTPVVFGISVPFPGCFEAALFTAKIIRREFKTDALIAFGGGYINTELRDITENRLFNYCDFISYDKGYGSFICIYDELSKIKSLFSEEKISVDLKSIFNGAQFYNTSYLCNNQIVKPLDSGSDEYKKICDRERKLVHTVTPDYTSIDFSKYPRLSDDTNPMHRIWNDGAWLKAYLAYGCYWHRCAFCDTTLDYVKNYCPADTEKLFDSLCIQAEKSGVYGIHFVDEACPPRSLEAFALKNIARKEHGTPLTYWGNIRFEKTFSRDLADLLSYGGLTAVSAGIEIATGTGLDSVNKGTDMKNIISACCAFKEAGILIHSYMIFGFWTQSPQDLIDSMETLRQLFKAGLLDSAFWHKFTLTLHSTVYEEYKNGKHPGLKIIPQKKDQFAKNDLHYEGEEKSEKYSAPLNTALELWMHGEKLNKSVETFFPFKMPKPSIAPDFVDSMIALYEKNRDKAFSSMPCENDSFVWIGGTVFVLNAGKDSMQLCWSYMGELLYADVDKQSAKNISDYINSISAKAYDSSEKFSSKSILNVFGKKLFLELRGKGLCKLI